MGLANSWWPPNNVGDEPLSWPTPPAGTSNQPSPSPREHALQPPPLTTTLNGPQFHGLGVALGGNYSSTPLSTTSLSSPFTQGQSPATNTPGGVGVGSSSMTSRQYNVPYNPQDWGPVGGSGQSTYPQTTSMTRIISQSRQAGSHSGQLGPFLMYHVPCLISHSHSHFHFHFHSNSFCFFTPLCFSSESLYVAMDTWVPI